MEANKVIFFGRWEPDFHNNYSEFENIITGVPQGSILAKRYKRLNWREREC